jgi:hypothetical protein
VRRIGGLRSDAGEQSGRDRVPPRRRRAAGAGDRPERVDRDRGLRRPGHAAVQHAALQVQATLDGSGSLVIPFGCQKAIGKASAKYLASVLKAMGGCLDKLNDGK